MKLPYIVLLLYSQKQFVDFRLLQIQITATLAGVSRLFIYVLRVGFKKDLKNSPNSVNDWLFVRQLFKVLSVFPRSLRGKKLFEIGHVNLYDANRRLSRGNVK